MRRCDGHEERFTLVGRRLPAACAVRWVLLEPVTELPYDPAEWDGALVVVEHGGVVLLTRCGRGLRLGWGAVMPLAGLPLRAVANPDPEPALLSVLERGARAAARALDRDCART